MKYYLILIPLVLCQKLVADEARTMHTYMMANYDQFGGNLLRAHRHYTNLMQSNAPIHSYKGYLHFLNSSGQYGEITRLAPQLEQRFAKDPDIGLIFAQAFRKMGKNEEADRRIIELSQQHKQNPEVIINAVEALVKRKELNNALNLIDTFLDNTTQKPSFSLFLFLKAQIFAQMQQYDKALEWAKKSLKLHPHFPQAWLFIAMLEEQAGHYAQAIQGFNTYLDKTGNSNGNIQRKIVEVTLKEVAARQQKPFAPSNLSCYQKALFHFKQQQYPAALMHVNRCLAEKTVNEEARLLKIQILVAMNRINGAIEQLVTWSQEPNAELWEKTLHLLVRANAPIDKVIQAFEQIEHKKRDNLTTLLYMADLYSRSHQYEKAIIQLKKALNQITDKELQTKVYFHLGLLEYQTGAFEQSQQTLEAGEALQLDFPPLLNLLAYQYATKGKKQEKANQLINRALKKDRKNPHYLDTKAVIWYKQGQYPRAIALLEKIAQHNPHDSTVLVHLAKAQHKQGLHDQARKTIEQARKLAKQPEELKIQKIANRWQQ